MRHQEVPACLGLARETCGFSSCQNALLATGSFLPSLTYPTSSLSASLQLQLQLHLHLHLPSPSFHFSSSHPKSTFGFFPDDLLPIASAEAHAKATELSRQPRGRAQMPLLSAWHHVSPKPPIQGLAQSVTSAIARTRENKPKSGSYSPLGPLDVLIG
jgi:hypothetical protein